MSETLSDILTNATSSGEEFNLDLTGAGDDNDFSTPLAKGEYVARIIDVEQGVTGEKSKNPGTPKLHWQFEVVEGPRAGKFVHGHFDLTSPTGKRKNQNVLDAVGTGTKFSKAAVVDQRVVLVMAAPKGDWDELQRVKAAGAAGEQSTGLSSL